jgi:translation initiation factor IF-3
MKRSEALALAESQGLDLVQLSYNPVDKVCTAKITDYGKYLYEKKKTTKEKKKTVNK